MQSNYADELQLSPGQLAIWRDIVVNPEGANGYNIGAYWEFIGPWDAARFKHAVDEVMDSTTALRLQLLQREDGSPPLQRIRRPVPGDYVRMIDCSGERDPAKSAQAWMRHDVSRTLELDAFPAFRIATLRLAADWHYGYTLFHHLFIDGVGFNLLQRRFAQALGLIEQQATLRQVSGADDDHRTYLASVSSYEQSADYAADKQYWENLHRTPAARVSLSAQEPQRASELPILTTRIELSRIDLDTLGRLADEIPASLTEVLFASVVLFVQRMTGADDIPIGLPVHGRPTNLRHRFVWMCMNVLPLRFSVDSSLEVRAFFADVIAQFREALRHQNYRYEVIRRDLGRLAELGMFGVSVNIIRNGAVPITVAPRPKLHVNYHALFTGRIEDLTIFILEGSGAADTLAVELRGNPAMYTEWELQSLADNLYELLRALSAFCEEQVASNEASAGPLMPTSQPSAATGHAVHMTS